MKIAHLIMAHQDFEHILRLTKRLSRFSDVFLHIDVNANADWLINALKENKNVYFLEERLHCEWGDGTALLLK